MDLITLIGGILVLAFNLTMEYGTLTMRRSIAVHVVVRCLALLLMIGILVAWDAIGLDKSTFLRTRFSTIPFYFACLFLFEESFAQKTFLFFMDFSVTACLTSICSWIGAVFLPSEYEPIVALVLLGCCLLALVPLYFRFVRHRVREMLFLFRQSKPFYAAFPFLSFLYYTVTFGQIDTPESPWWLIRLLMYVTLVVLAYYLLFSHFHSVYDRLMAEQDRTRAERQLTLQKKYYEEVDKGIQAQRRLIHDTRHHFVAVSSLAQAGQAAAIEQYIERLLESYGKEGVAVYCENVVANAVIGGYVKIAESKGIAVSADLELPQDMGIDDYELCALFGNTIENAIEACDRIPAGTEQYGKRRIAIKARARKGRLVVDIENSFLEEAARTSLVYPSSKGSGIGLASVKRIVDLHEGSMSCDRRQGTFIFSAVLCLEPESQEAAEGLHPLCGVEGE